MKTLVFNIKLLWSEFNTSKVLLILVLFLFHKFLINFVLCSLIHMRCPMRDAFFHTHVVAISKKPKLCYPWHLKWILDFASLFTSLLASLCGIRFIFTIILQMPIIHMLCPIHVFNLCLYKMTSLSKIILQCFEQGKCWEREFKILFHAHFAWRTYYGLTVWWMARGNT